MSEPETEITAVTAVLIDGDTGQVLYDKNMHEKRHPASITKVMTGLLTVENCKPDEIAVVSEEAVKIPPNSSNEALTPGEELTVDSVMYAMMLRSANEASNVLAEHVAGSQSAFADQMTRRAKELGAKNTSFVNASGLPDDQHLTTAYDMAVITRAAIQNADFLTYFGTGRHTIPPTNKQPNERPFTNQMFMLLPDQAWCYNPDVIGGKVGYTEEARHTMASAASKGGRTLVAVVMGCGPDEKFDDTQALFDFGFDAFQKVELPSENIAFTIPVVDGEGEAVGEAAFVPASGAPATMLLPGGADIGALEYKQNAPSEMREDGDLSGIAVTVSLPGTALSMEIPVEGDLSIHAQPSMISGELAGEGASRFVTGAAAAAVVGALLLLLIGAVLIRREKIRRRALRRKQRQERILQDRQRYSA